jgi:signal transduction histidine kinase
MSTTNADRAGNRGATPPPGPTTILVIDDKEPNRLLIRHLFDGPQHRVLEAADGVEGLALAQQARPDCILLDLDMPRLGGFEVLERLAADPRMREIPVIILTATDDSLDAMKRALTGGAVDYITKPISPLRVEIRVRGAIERRRLLRELQDLRASFTTMLVHDLRAPLTVIRGYVDLLQQGKPGPVTERQARYLGAMQTSCARMIRLIGEILDVSKLEAGRLSIERQPVDLRALTGDVVERVAPVALGKSIEVGMGGRRGPMMVLADPARLEQVLMNLLSNAIKFTPAGGRVTVELAQAENEVEVAVVDTGPGIAAEEMPLLFEKFRQTSSAKFGQGTGLGLVICRHLVEAHGGRIWAESDGRSGSRFAFRLPRKAGVGSAQGDGDAA